MTSFVGARNEARIVAGTGAAAYAARPLMETLELQPARASIHNKVI